MYYQLAHLPNELAEQLREESLATGIQMKDLAADLIREALAYRNAENELICRMGMVPPEHHGDLVYNEQEKAG